MDRAPSKLGFSWSTAFPPYLSTLFRARSELPYLEPESKHYRQSYSCVLSLKKEIDRKFDLIVKNERLPSPPPKVRRIIEHYLYIKAQRELYNPLNDRKTTKNPQKTLFISNLAYSVTEDDLERKLRRYGKISDLRIVRDKKGKSRGYAFIQFKHTKDLIDAYHEANNMKIEGRKIKVDYERARIQKSWFPRRLDGGKGGRKDPKDQQFISNIIKQYEEGQLQKLYDLSFIKDLETEKIEQKVGNKRIKIKEESDTTCKYEKKSWVYAKSSYPDLSTDGEDLIPGRK